MKKNSTLNEVGLNEEVKIKKIDCTGNVKRRILDFFFKEEIWQRLIKKLKR